MHRFQKGQSAMWSPGKGQLDYNILDLMSSPGTGSGHPRPLGGPFRFCETFLRALPRRVGARPSLDPFPFTSL